MVLELSVDRRSWIVTLPCGALPCGVKAAHGVANRQGATNHDPRPTSNSSSPILSSSAGAPTPIPDQEIFNIKTVLEQKMHLDPYEGECKLGHLISIKTGPLSGVEGLLKSRKGVHKLVLSVNLLRQAVAVTLSAEYAEKMG